MSATPVATDFSQLTALRAAASREDPAALHKAAQQFEALLTQELLKTAHQTHLGDDLTGEQGDFYNDVFDRQMALHLSSGKGLGLAAMLERQLAGHADAGAASGTVSATPQHQTSSAGTAATPAVSADVAAPTTARDASAPAANALAFVQRLRPLAEKAAVQLGVPVRAVLAHAALESGWGQHAPGGASSSSHNLFGIKSSPGAGDAVAAMTSEYGGAGWRRENASFRSYAGPEKSISDYVSFLKDNPRYAVALSSGTVSGFAHGLQQAGYATDPAYAQKLMSVAFSPAMNRALSGATTVTA